MYKLEQVGKKPTYMDDEEFDKLYLPLIDPIYLSNAYSSHVIKINKDTITLTKIER
jgi:hypothetical protein